MAVAWKSQSGTVSAARAGSTATYSMTVTYPSMAIGDAVFIVAANWNNTGPNLWTQPTGYNTIASSQFSTSFFYRLVDGTEGASINITMPSGNAIYGTQVYCTVFSGVTSVDSAHSNYIQQTTAGSSSPDCPWLTTIGATDMGLVVWTVGKSSGSLGTLSFPAGMSGVLIPATAGSTNNVAGMWAFPPNGSSIHAAGTSTVSETTWEVMNVVMRGAVPSVNTGFFEMFE